MRASCIWPSVEERAGEHHRLGRSNCRNEEGVHSSIVVFEGNLHGSLPDIVNSGAPVALDDFVGLLKITIKVFSDIGDAGGAAVVDAKVEAVRVKGGFDLDAVVGGRWIRCCSRRGNQGAHGKQGIDEEMFLKLNMRALQRLACAGAGA